MKKYNGFTLIEIMIVMAIAGTLLVLAGPGMRSYLSNSSSDRLGNEIMIDIMYARNHAISSSLAVTMVPLDPTLGGSPGGLVFPGAGVNWGAGWQIFEQNNPFPIRQKQFNDPSFQIRSIDPINILDQARPISFTNQGISQNPGTLAAGVLGCSGQNAMTIQVNQIGQVITNANFCDDTFANN